jgi:8-oxo-dGTP pyrophosphatase MutT (NUDIX family)
MLIAVGVLVAMVLILWLYATANRLDRLHIKTDAAWAGLEAALARRAVVARAVVVAGGAPASLREIADHAEKTPRADREAAENELSRELAAVDREQLPFALIGELVDAEQRVVIARRMHNDAVRDTLTQRRRRMVRWFKLAGTAPRPEYFEIAEPGLTGDLTPTTRRSARILLLDKDGRILLFHGKDVTGSFWFTVGGGVEEGEDLHTAAIRELHEETGLRLPDDRLVGPVWRRRVVFSFDGRSYDAEEWFFLAKTTATDIDTAGFTQLERDTIDEHRWWSAADLRATRHVVYPVQLPDLLPSLLSTDWDGQTRPVR